MLWEHALELDAPGATAARRSGIARTDQPGPQTGLPRRTSPPWRTSIGMARRTWSPRWSSRASRGDRASDRRPQPALAQGRSRSNRQTLARRVIQAVSGRTGRTLWNYPIDPTFTTPLYPAWTRSATIVVPAGNRRRSRYVDGDAVDRARPGDRQTARGADRPGVRARSGRSSMQTWMVTANPRSWQWGRARPAISRRWPRSRSARVEISGPRPINAEYPIPGRPVEPSDWPLVVDLDGDGRSEVVVPDSGPMPPADGYRGVRRARWSIRPDAVDPADAPGDQGRGWAGADSRCARPRPRRRSRPGHDLVLPGPVSDDRP